MNAQRVLIVLLVLTGAGCSHECRIENDLPTNAAQSKALADAHARVGDYCRSAVAKCRYRIAQAAEGLIMIHADHLYDAPDGSGCGGDLYDAWKYSSTGDYAGPE